MLLLSSISPFYPARDPHLTDLETRPSVLVMTPDPVSLTKFITTSFVHRRERSDLLFQ